MIKMKNNKKEIKIKIQKLSNEDKTKSTAFQLFKIADLSYPNGSPWSQKQFYETMQVKNTHIYVAIAETNVEEELVGLLITVDTKIEMDIYMIAVHEEYQNNQIGRRLLNTMIADAKELAIEEVYLEVRVSNLVAIRLYKRMNFTEIGYRKKYYAYPIEDALLMRLKIREN